MTATFTACGTALASAHAPESTRLTRNRPDIQSAIGRMSVNSVVDMPSHGLKTGDVDAVVHVYSKDAVEVEFVTASGRTQALVTLATASIRPVSSKDILAVRQLDAA